MRCARAKRILDIQRTGDTVPRFRPAGETLPVHRRARSEGRLLSLASAEWSVAGDCERPVYVEVAGRRTVSSALGKASPTNFTDLYVRCRKCPACLRARAAHWRMRIRFEVMASLSTWFVTYTVKPDWHVRWTYEVEQKYSGDAVFAALCRREYRELTLAHKRLRRAGHNFRFVAVTERHKSGWPHFHVLYHQIVPSLTTRVLAGNRFEGVEPMAWPFGFVSAKLVRQDIEQEVSPVVGYIAKYLVKSPDAQIRASLHYGLGPGAATG